MIMISNHYMRRFSICAMPPDILACIFVPLHCETLDDHALCFVGTTNVYIVLTIDAFHLKDP